MAVKVAGDGFRKILFCRAPVQCQCNPELPLVVVLTILFPDWLMTPDYMCERVQCQAGETQMNRSVDIRFAAACTHNAGMSAN